MNSITALENKDSCGYDICQIPNKTPEELYNICQFIPFAVGFNQNGWLKWYISDSNIKDEPGCTLYRINKSFKQAHYTLPEIWVHTQRDDVKEFYKIQFGGDNVHFCGKDPVTELANSNREMVIVLKEDVELAERIVEKMSHALAIAQIYDWDVLSFAGTDTLTNEFPTVVPFFSDPNFGFCITRLGAIKLLNKQKITVKSCFPNLVRGVEKKSNLMVTDNENYRFFMKNLEYNVKNSDISTFKSWDCLGKKGLWIYVPDDHLANNNYNANLEAALKRFTLQHLRDPMPNFATKENGTDAIIVRHAGDFARANIDLNKYEHILEVGGGYGALANILLSSGYQGTYTIYDFPLMEAVVKRYIQYPFNFVSCVDDIQTRPKTLLISTWGISEMPTELINMILGRAQPQGVYIIAQNSYEQRDNVELFSKLLGFRPVPYDERSSKFFRF